MIEREGAITFKGDPLTLLGEPISERENARPFTLTATDLAAKSLDDFKGKVIILSTVPSLDTSTCSVQTKRFNKAAGQLGDDAVVLTVSMDLPFAQKRWCGNEDADNIVPLSDYKDHQFGYDYGLRIKELGVLARSVSVIDKSGKVVHHELVKEVSEEPNYDAALDAARSAN